MGPLLFLLYINDLCHISLVSLARLFGGGGGGGESGLIPQLVALVWVKGKR